MCRPDAVCASGLLLIGLLAAPSIARGNAWSELETDAHPETGYVLSQREVADSAFPEYRLVTSLEASPEEVARAAIRFITSEKYAPSGQTRRTLRNDERGILSHLYIEVPIVADRDVTSWIELTHGDRDGSLQLKWREANDEGPPPTDGAVRIPRLHGSFDFIAEGEGTRVIYQTYVDFGGTLPAFIVSSFLPSQVKAQILGLRRALADLLAEPSEAPFG